MCMVNPVSTIRSFRGSSFTCGRRRYRRLICVRGAVKRGVLREGERMGLGGGVWW